MIHRLAISIGTIAACAVLAIGVAASGFGPAAAPATAGQPTSVESPAAADPMSDNVAAKPITRVKTKTVYVKPAPKAKVIHVTKREPAPVAKRPKVKVVRVNKDRPAKHQDREDHEDEDHEDEDKHEDEDGHGDADDRDEDDEDDEDEHGDDD